MTGSDPVLAGVAHAHVSLVTNNNTVLENLFSGRDRYIERNICGNIQGPAGAYFAANFREVAEHIGISVVGTNPAPELFQLDIAAPRFDVLFSVESIQLRVEQLRTSGVSDVAIVKMVRDHGLFGYKGLRTLYLNYYASWSEHCLAGFKNKPAGTIRVEALRVRQVRTQAFDATKTKLLSEKRLLETGCVSDDAGRITILVK